VPVAAVADTVTTSEALVRSSAKAVVEPENVFLAVKVLATAVPGTARLVRASAAVVALVPPFARGKVPVTSVVKLMIVDATLTKSEPFQATKAL
jgi:hypothetical protein